MICVKFSVVRIAAGRCSSFAATAIAVTSTASTVVMTPSVVRGVWQARERIGVNLPQGEKPLRGRSDGVSVGEK
jgi:hypothetical protein